MIFSKIQEMLVNIGKMKEMGVKMDECGYSLGIIQVGAIILFIILVLSLLFETGIYVYSYLNADKVECNLLWCKFTQERREIIQDCYQNGVMVNCSNMPDISWLE